MEDVENVLTVEVKCLFERVENICGLLGMGVLSLEIRNVEAEEVKS